MKKGANMFLIFFLILAVLLGYLFLLNKNKESPNTNAPAMTDKTRSGYTTFTSPNKKFELQYPVHWTNSHTDGYIHNFFDDKNGIGALQISANIIEGDNDGTPVNQESLTQFKKELEKKYSKYETKKYKNFDAWFEQRVEDDFKVEERVVYTDRLVLIATHIYKEQDDLSDEKEVKIVEQIIDSIKFL